MEVKVRKAGGGVELSGSLPADIAGAAALEIFPLRDGIYLLSIKGALEAHREASRLSEPERALVRKLLAIRFERRTPAEADRALSREEKATLASLLAKKVVTLFRSGKYENGVYNVSDAAFGQTKDASGAPHYAAAQPVPAHDPLAQGWLALDNEGDARQLSSAVAERIKAGEVSGLRAFDRKYYFIRKDFAVAHRPGIMSALEKGGKTADEIARALGLPQEACLAILLHMAEGGELLEKSRGRFALA
ncbi:MAG: hypothetical protein WC717_02370 [Candidatus Micrarchaeia archaeon]|jgi:hypothetical protein